MFGRDGLFSAFSNFNVYTSLCLKITQVRQKVYWFGKARILIFFSLVLLCQLSHGQCPKKQIIYRTGEEIKYKAYYNLGFIWIHAGYANFYVKDTTIRNTSFYKFYSEGYSHEDYDWFFKVRDYFTSINSKTTLDPIYFHRDNLEGDYWVKNTYVFSKGTNKVYSITNNKEDGFSQDTLDMKPCLSDVLTAIYKTRSFDYSETKFGDTIPLTMIVDGDIYNLYIRYKGKEIVELKELGRKVQCVKFTVMLLDGTVFKGGEDMTVWVTDDANKVPVLVEAKILIGSVKALIVEYKNLVTPITFID